MAELGFEPMSVRPGNGMFTCHFGWITTGTDGYKTHRELVERMMNPVKVSLDRQMPAN